MRFQHISDDPSPRPPRHGPPEKDAAADAELLDAYSRAVIGVVQKVGPAVVCVEAHRGQQNGGQGSGFVITPDGYALTNSHVAGQSVKLSAITEEGDRLHAELIGDDPATDLAVLRVQARDLPYCELGDSSALQVGQLVIAVGNPLGFRSTVSTGVVSAVGRAMRGVSGRLIENVVQHTAPLNPGNSGGPLVDSHGHVVGINTAIIAFAQGLGFAVPAGTAQWVAGELIAHGQVRRRQLGISAAVVALSRSLVRELDLLADQAVEVIEVAAGSSAARAGIRPGDLLVAANDRIVTSVDDIHRLLTRLPHHQSLGLRVVRDGKLMDVLID
jgi:S1-C subfamily serine protease